MKTCKNTKAYSILSLVDINHFINLQGLCIEQEEEANAAAESKTEIGWGHQIRSYVLQPYQMVKDLRTGVENGNPQAVLDGSLDPFMEAALAQRVSGEAVEVSDID